MLRICNLGPVLVASLVYTIDLSPSGATMILGPSYRFGS